MTTKEKLKQYSVCVVFAGKKGYCKISKEKEKRLKQINKEIIKLTKEMRRLFL